MPCASSPNPGFYALAPVHSLNVAPTPSLASGLATLAPSASCSSWDMPCFHAFADAVLSTWNLLLHPLPDKFPPIHPLKPKLGPCLSQAVNLSFPHATCLFPLILGKLCFQGCFHIIRITVY